MDQKKIGAFMKELRKEKRMTQEALAEHLNVSGRTVSRWETGFNMPDLDILIEMADFYQIEIRELLDGERKSETMNKEMEETALKIADYSNAEKQRLAKRLCVLFMAGVIAFIIYMAMNFMGIDETFADGAVAGIALGFAFGMMIVGVLYTSGALMKFKAFKRRLLHRHKAETR